MALSTLEGITAELGEMGPDERRRFIDALNRIAAGEPNRANWIHGLPRTLGLIEGRSGNDGAVNNGANTASTVISDAGTGSTASGSMAVRSGEGA